MKRALLVILGLFLMNSFGLAQVLYDFEKDANGFSDNGWGKGFTSVGQAADPTGKSSGVLKLDFDGSKDGKGDIQKDDVSANKAQVLTYWVYLPQDTPDSLVIKLWGQDNKNWAWTEQAYVAKSIPKQVWYPLNFYMEQYRIKNGNFDVTANKIGKMGIEVANWDEKDADKNWKGSIYIDNVTLVGVESKTFADFETDLNGFSDNGWGKGFTSVTKAADPTNNSKGVMALQYNSTDKGALQKDNVDAKGFNMIVYYVYLPQDTPDSIGIKLWAQDDKNWAWTEQLYHFYDIPKGKWYPIYFDMAAINVSSGGKLDNQANKLGKMGIEVSNWDEKSDSKWNGTFYIDNASFIGTETGVKWVIADFEAQAAGVQGFTVPNWAATMGMSNLVRAVDNNNGVLKGDIDFSKGKVAIKKDGLSLYYAEKDTIIDAVTIDVFLPSDMPKGGGIDIALQNTSNWDWINKSYSVSDTGLAPGKWNKLTWSVAEFRDRIADRKAKFDFYVEFKFDATTTWKGSVEFDNLTLVGIPKPQGTVESPKTVARVDTSKAPGYKFKYVRLDWIDNTVGTETYNIYASTKPITDLKSPDVVQIAAGVPHGAQQWAHRPYTKNGGPVTYYYAITAMDPTNGETPLLDQAKVGPVTVESSPTAKIKYVKDFASKFVLDGMDNEFESYKVNQIVPESATGGRSSAWSLTSSDMNWKTTMVIDDKYLYISADVTDDDLNRDVLQQAWSGDALEFYLGIYDVAKLNVVHPKNSGSSVGDWRIGFNALGSTTLNGGPSMAVPGTESAVFEKLTGDGYIIEAKICLDSIAPGNKFTVYNNMMLPCRIDGNDTDPSKKDAGRGLLAQWGGWDYFSENKIIELDNHWLRPGTFGMLQVIDAPADPSGVEESASLLPKEFKLHNNYPNPFNPSTMIKYDLPKEAHVELQIFDITGRRVATLVNTQQNAGYHEVSFNASNLSSGIYLYRISAGEFQQVKKMMLLK